MPKNQKNWEIRIKFWTPVAFEETCWPCLPGIPECDQNRRDMYISLQQNDIPVFFALIANTVSNDYFKTCQTIGS